MARRPKMGDPGSIVKQLLDLLNGLYSHLLEENLRPKVQALIPASRLMTDLGSSLLGKVGERSARNRMLVYLKMHVGQVLDGEELMVGSAISEYARRVRELRIQEGCPILSGGAAQDLRDAAEADASM